MTSIVNPNQADGWTAKCNGYRKAHNIPLDTELTLQQICDIIALDSEAIESRQKQTIILSEELVKRVDQLNNELRHTGRKREKE